MLPAVGAGDEVEADRNIGIGRKKNPTHPVQQRRDPPELQQLMPLEPLRESDSVVLVVRLQTAPERNVVLLLDEQVVVRLVDDGKVETLRGDEVRLGEWEVVVGLEDLDDSAVVKPGRQRGEEVGQERGLNSVSGMQQPEAFLQMSSPDRHTHLVRDVERHRLVRNLHVGNLHHDLLELIVVPVGQTLHHRQSSVVGLVCAGR